jgi:HEAT repeat protein
MLERCRGEARTARADFDLPRRCITCLVSLRAAEAVPVLVSLAQTEVGLRNLAVQALIDLRAEAAAPALLPLLAKLHDTQHDERLVHGLLFLMTVVDYRFAQPEVRRFLAHRLGGVRCSALKAVARWQDLDAVEQVRSMCYSDPSAFVRPCAVACLGRLLGATALPDLEALADDANTLVRNAVADALGRLSPLPPRGLAVLTRLLDDGPVAQAARIALSRHEDTTSASEPASAQPIALVPPELQGQVPAARAFLRQWQAGLPAEDETGELRRALGLLLTTLTAPLAARPAA